MSPGARAYIGAVIGALIVLTIHPRSRPFLLSRTLLPTIVKEIQLNPNLPENVASLSAPLSPAEASLWLQTGAELDLTGAKLKEEQYITLAEIAQHGEISEPDNAFWPQMKSVFIGRALTSIGKGREPSIEAWLRASQLTSWNDHQAPRLQLITSDLARQSGAKFAWHQAVAFSRRSTAVTQRLLRHSRQIESDNSLDLRIKIANVKNGTLVREGAKSVAACAAGATMVDMAGIRRPGSYGAARVTAEAFGVLMRSIPVSDVNERRQLALAFLLNQAWSAYVPVRESAQRAINLTQLSIIVAVLPSALLLSGIVGLVVYFVGRILAGTSFVQKCFTSPVVVYIGLALAILVFGATRLVFPSLWTLIVFALFSIASDRAKSTKPTGLGVVFQSTIALLAVLVATSLVIHMAETSASEQLLAKAAALPSPDAGTGVVPLQLVFLGLSMVVATAPAWGFLYRYNPRVVLPESLRSFGAYLGIGALSLAVVATPICLVVDQRISKDFSEMVQNEPNHYLTLPTNR